MVEHRRRRALLALGVVLIATPIWAPTLDVTGPDHTYESVRVTVADDRIRVADDAPRLVGFDDIDCYRERVPSRRCVFEARLISGRSLRASHPSILEVSGNPPLDAEERYVAFAGDGRVFRRTADWNESAGGYVLGLRRANATAVLDGTARPLDRASPPVRRAVESGSARAADRLDEPRLVTTGGRYHLVYTAGQRTLLSERPLAERLFELVAVGVGLALVLSRR